MNEPTTSDPYRTPAASRREPDDVLRHPYEGQTRMRLVLSSGVTSARLRVDPSADALVSIDAGGGPAPRLRVHAGEVRLSWPLSPGEWLRAFVSGQRPELVIDLHPAVVWSIVVWGGVSALSAELAGGAISGIEVGGGCSDVELELPRPAGIVPVRVSGGASRLRVLRPADVPVALAVHGGVTTLRLDGRRFEAIGGAARLESEGVPPGEDGYEIDVRGGASDVEVASAQGAWA